MTPLVRRAHLPDADALASVHRETVTFAYAGIFPPESKPPSLVSLVEEWRASFEDPTFAAFLLEESGRAVGTVGIRSDPGPPGCGQLRKLHVLPDRWGSGLGSMLHDTAIEAMQGRSYARAGLWVLEANDRARSFYERRGWRLDPGRTLQLHGQGTLELRYELVLGRGGTLARS